MLESSSSISESLSSSGSGIAIAVRSEGSVVKSIAVESLGTLILKRGGGSWHSTGGMSKFFLGEGVGGVRTVEGGEEGRAVNNALFVTEARGGETGGGRSWVVVELTCRCTEKVDGTDSLEGVLECEADTVLADVVLLIVALPLDTIRRLGDVAEVVDWLETGDGARSLSTLLEDIEGEIARF